MTASKPRRASMPIMAARPLRSSFSLVHMPASSALVLERKGTTEAAVKRAMVRRICVGASPNCW